uniref:Secreted protein n=1 Tax=Achlya hypogyna TaxID=1202772 RepID=A0A0A7CLM9_ACHHY|nr:secreted protein [Achlya hypogyna]
MKFALAAAVAASAVTLSKAGICTGITPASYQAAIQTNTQFQPAIAELQKYPVATWYVDCGSDSIDALLSTCGNDIPVIVVYGLPGKDCASGYSGSGTNTNPGQYKAWVQSLANRVGNKKVIYILEPDAVGLISNNNCAVQNKYQDNLQVAQQILSANTNAQIYVDVAAWSNRDAAVAALKKLGKVAGIAINTSNYKSTGDMTALCQTYSSATGGLHCIIDTSRNFNGSPQNEWCNARSAGIGAPPTSNTGNPIVDYYLWLKVPGESDGLCNDKDRTSDSMVGPQAGQFFGGQFTTLWNQGYFVKNGLPKIGQAPVPDPSPAPPTSTCSTKNNWDYYDNDLYNFGVGGSQSDQVSTCCSKCQSDNNCQAFTVAYNNCYIKSSTGNGGRVLNGGIAGTKNSSGASSGTCGAIKANTDFYGNDMSRYPVSGDTNSQTTFCCGKCSETSGCAGYTINGGFCYLKSKVATSYWSATAVSAVRSTATCSATQANTDYYGNDMSRHPVSGDANAQATFCCGKCTATSGCAGYTINGGFCYLKSKIETSYWSPSAVSGRRITTRLRRE